MVNEILFFTGLLVVMVLVIALATELHAGWLQDPERGNIDKEDKPLLVAIEYGAFYAIAFLLRAPFWQILAVSTLFPAIRWLRDYPLNLLIRNDWDYIGKNAFSDRALHWLESWGFSQHFVRAGFFLAMFSISMYLYLSHYYA